MIKKTKNIKKIELTLLVIIILLLVNLPAAHSYLIHQSDLQETIVFDKKIKKTNLLITLLKEFFSIKQIGTVSAAIGDQCCTETIDRDYCQDVSFDYSDCVGELYLGTCEGNNCEVFTSMEVTIPPATVDINVQFNCCPEMIDGSICQDILETDSQFCLESPLPTNCDNTNICQEGCCFDDEEGLCTPKSKKQKCRSDGGEWDSDKDCNINECQKGCCVLGSDVQFVTEKRCEWLSQSQGFEDFRDLETEIECLVLTATQEYGACVEGGSCAIKTNSECSGDFEED